MPIAFGPPPLYDESSLVPCSSISPGAVYHVTSRGDRREPIYLDALAELARSAQREVPRAQRLAPTRASSRKTKPLSWKGVGVKSCLLPSARLRSTMNHARWGQVLRIAYHVTSRGDRREPIYCDDDDRLAHLDAIAHAMDRFDAQVLAYCLMGNHYHLVLHTRASELGVKSQYCSFS